jgi:hypothetical protein
MFPGGWRYWLYWSARKGFLLRGRSVKAAVVAKSYHDAEYHAIVATQR